MPPLKPKLLIPVPAPTEPSPTLPSLAAATASSASISVTARAWMSDRKPSLHSSTTGLTVPVSRPMSGLAAMAARTSAVAQVPTAKVLVKRIGVSTVPSSATCIRPVLLPKPLITSTAARALVAEQVAGMRQDGGDAGQHVAGMHAEMADQHAGHIGDGVERAGRQRAADQAEIARETGRHRCLP